MLRLAAISLLAVSLPVLQSGCCCCRLPAAMLRFGAAANVVNNQPPIVVNQPPPFQPPNQPPPPFQPPVPNPPVVQKDGPPAIDLGNPLQKREYVYSQGTGQLKLGNDIIGTGYSGRGAARNNPAMQNQRNNGPIPAGDFTIMARRADGKTGEPIIEMLPAPPSNAAGRFPGETFKIRCETNPPGSGGAGDIVLPRASVDRIDAKGFPKLKVVP